MTTVEPFSRTDLAPQRGTRLALVHGGSYPHLQTMKDPAVLAHQPDFHYLADLADGDLDGYSTVIVETDCTPTSSLATPRNSALSPSAAARSSYSARTRPTPGFPASPGNRGRRTSGGGSTGRTR